jgi:hypothetical protein
MRLARKLLRAHRLLMRPKMIVLMMRSRSGLMSMRSLQMTFGSSRVMCSGHKYSPSPRMLPLPRAEQVYPKTCQPPTPPKTHETPINTSDLYFQNLA